MIRSLARSALHAIGPLHRALSRRRGTRIDEPEWLGLGTARLGSDYGGWTVIPALLGPQSTVWAVGVGTDISFDLALIERFGCTIDAFDPTPLAGEWIAAQSLPERFRFHAIGLAANDGEARFSLPAVAGHVSFGLADADTEGSVPCPVRRAETLARELGQERLDLVKMDIEGFEYQVIADMLAGPLRPRQWLIEFHHAMYQHTASQTHEAVTALRAAGYRLFAVSNVGHEYSFVHQSALGAG